MPTRKLSSLTWTVCTKPNAIPSCCCQMTSRHPHRVQHYLNTSAYRHPHMPHEVQKVNTSLDDVSFWDIIHIYIFFLFISNMDSWLTQYIPSCSCLDPTKWIARANGWALAHSKSSVKKKWMMRKYDFLVPCYDLLAISSIWENLETGARILFFFYHGVQILNITFFCVYHHRTRQKSDWQQGYRPHDKHFFRTKSILLPR